ncbi:MAG: hypothetical protein CMJ75_05610 [Planctomycetaceae bacterium]|nr:hypothetical protein [Planctomycetaceae bacterium]
MQFRGLKIKARLYFRRCRKYLYHSILHADDPPHKLALGVALAMFVMFTPTLGLQMIITVFLAWLLRANKAVGLPVVWISNPVTFVPIFYPCYVVGCWLLNQPPQIDSSFWTRLSTPPSGAGIQHYWDLFKGVAAPLWIGGIIVGTLLGALTYFLLYFSICRYRMRRWGQLVPPKPRFRH